jgi:HSP20 family protein
MNLTLWNRRDPLASLNPFNGNLARLKDDMDRSFEQLFNTPLGAIAPKTGRTEGWVPPLDVSETDAEVTIRMEVPGIATKDLDLSVMGNTLYVAGKKELHEERKGEDFYQSERRFGSFRRIIELPDTADADRVTAESENGVVCIRVAKKPGAKPKQIEVKPVSKKVPVSS